MAITLSAAAKTAVANTLVDLVDVGTANPEGAMIVKTAAAAVLVRIDFANPAFGAASAGVATLLGVPLTGIAGATGLAALFDVVNRDDTVVYSGTVGIAGSGADAIIDSTSITSADTVQLNSHTVTAP